MNSDWLVAGSIMGLGAIIAYVGMRVVRVLDCLDFELREMRLEVREIREPKARTRGSAHERV